MNQDGPFCYQPVCSSPGCTHEAKYKIAAGWSDGTSHELKCYGLACEHHWRDQFDQARRRSASLSRARGEVVGPVEVFHLEAGCRDAALTRVTEQTDGMK